jgi:hypothetical protein
MPDFRTLLFGLSKTALLFFFQLLPQLDCSQHQAMPLPVDGPTWLLRQYIAPWVGGVNPYR